MGFTPEERATLRRRIQTDLFFFCKHILKMDVTEQTHRAMCDFYPKLDPDQHFKDFAQNYAGAHDYMMLVPRTTYKSSIKVAQNAQMIVTYPEIRIITLTATKKLAEAFVEKVNKLFVIKGDVERKLAISAMKPNKEYLYEELFEGGRPTVFQSLFPEHCITETEKYEKEYTTPARTLLPENLQEKEPSIGALSIESAGSGWHCDSLDNDDPVSDENSETGNMLERLDERIAMAKELVMNYGFRFTVATRYHPLDPYGSLARDSGVTKLYGDYEGEDFKYMCRPCWWLKGSKDFAQPDYRTWIPNPDEVELFFPEGSPFLALKKKMRKPKTFFSQQLNSPVEAAEITFTEQKVRDCIRDRSELPKRGRLFGTCDIAYTASTSADYSVICIGLIDDDNRCWIIDIVRGRWSGSELALKLVQTYRKYGPEQIGIEDSNGAQFLLSDLDRFAKQMSVETNFYFMPMGQGRKDKKMERIGSLESLMVGGRLFILRDCLTPPNGNMDDLIREFLSFPNKKARNDIADAMSLLTDTYLPFSLAGFGQGEAEDRAFKEMNEREAYDMIFGQGKWEQLQSDKEADQNREPEWEDPFGKRDPITGLPTF